MSHNAKPVADIVAPISTVATAPVPHEPQQAARARLGLAANG